jgi:hypothetical protein
VRSINSITRTSITEIELEENIRRKELTPAELGFQEHLPENVRLEGMTDWRTVHSVVKTVA